MLELCRYRLNSPWMLPRLDVVATAWAPEDQIDLRAPALLWPSIRFLRGAEGDRQNSADRWIGRLESTDHSLQELLGKALLPRRVSAVYRDFTVGTVVNDLNGTCS